MKTKGFVRLTLIGGLFLTLLLLLTPAAKAQKSGAYYWGDGDGNGLHRRPGPECFICSHCQPGTLVTPAFMQAIRSRATVRTLTATAPSAARMRT